MKKDKTIIAVLSKPRGRGKLRHWFAFKVMGPELCQADVEDLMLRMGYDVSKYFLQEPSNFVIDGEEPHHHRMIGDRLHLQVFFETAWFEDIENKRTFVLMDKDETNDS